MKILKKLLLTGLFLTSFSSVFAGTLFDSSAGTVADETSSAFDYIDWKANDLINGNLLSFKLDGVQSINGLYLNKNDSGKQIAVSVESGFTQETFFPQLRAMFGFKNIGLLWQFELNKIDANKQAPNFGFGGGINFHEKFGFGLFFNMYGYEVRRIQIENSNNIKNKWKYDAIYYPTLQLDGMLRFRNNETVSDKLKIHLNVFGAYLESDTTPFKEIKINPIVSYNFSVAISNNVVYGFRPEYNFLIGTGSLTTRVEGMPDIKTETLTAHLKLSLNNGVTGSLFNDKILLSCGLKTTIIDVSSTTSENKTADDGKPIKGSKISDNLNQFFTNTITAGGALYVTDNFHIDFNTVVDVASGVSLEDVFKQKWSLSLTAIF